MAHKKAGGSSKNGEIPILKDLGLNVLGAIRQGR